MVSLTCEADHREGVTLVTARLEGDEVAQRVRLANRLDGPVWPPRREGVPEAGWNGDRFETVVPADGAVAVGYASSAPPVDPPVAVVERAVVDENPVEDHDENTAEDAVTPAEALRDLGDPSPPRDAVPIPIDESPEPPAQPTSGSADGSDQGTATGPEHGDASRQRVASADQPTAGRDTERSRASTRKPARPADRRSDGEVPDPVAAWLDAVEARVATAERLAATETLPEATAAMREAGGLDAAGDLVETLEDDADALESVARRAERLADRTAAADVPLETFERLA